MGVKIKTNFDTKKLESAIKAQTKESLKKRPYDVKCPHCHRTFSAYSGKNNCPHCKSIVDLNLNINF